MKSICHFLSTTDKRGQRLVPCDKRKNGECTLYVDEPIPIHHLGGMMPFPTKDNEYWQEGIEAIPRLGYGCCEYIYQRDKENGIEHEIGNHIQDIHNLEEAIPIVKSWDW